MSDLERFADHCRAMATAEHKPECCRCGRPYCCGCVGHPDYHPGWDEHYGTTRWAEHAARCPGNPGAPPCPGCVTDADRALWTRLADEVAAYLDPHPTLWRDA